MGLQQVSKAQLPATGTVEPKAVKNLASNNLTDETELTIQNTSTVPLTFCMAREISGTCINNLIPVGITVNAASAANVTIKQLGGVSTGKYLNVTNESFSIATYVVVVNARVPDNPPPCALTTDPTAWVIDPAYTSLRYKTMYLCPERYSRLAINQSFASSGYSAEYNLSVGGTGGFTGDVTILGKVGIGGIYPYEFANTKLAVNGLISARAIRVFPSNVAFPDYVFEKDYSLMGLKELEEYILVNKHLPGIPSAKEVNENKGIELGEMNYKLLEKVEELSLYVIAQQKLIEQLQEEVKEVRKIIE